MDFFGVYGPISTTNRDKFWLELKGLKSRWGGPWVIGGDFNVIRFVSKKGPRGRITYSMRDFEEFVRFGCLWDSPLSNAKFTWTNG